MPIHVFVIYHLNSAYKKFLSVFGSPHDYLSHILCVIQLICDLTSCCTIQGVIVFVI